MLDVVVGAGLEAVVVPGAGGADLSQAPISSTASRAAISLIPADYRLRAGPARATRHGGRTKLETPVVTVLARRSLPNRRGDVLG
ncbi:hypothetical protein MKCMC460_26730 [Mycobacterium sp. 20KCMC460]|nr:hypothetical protein MKCMC460_26730 [Mycobacterium sp. 20KCMC460]GLB90811.1 hypothetical protein SRL2020130_36280 [Mycobacterium kiyosense]GLC00867.1 hypothetical protein SRL2020400_14580 [Mycobacterium kiyosense]GLC12270.1 hypothetical protein SRL2020448_08730 [Mycobacterium kiyosense]GLD25267.1 hypothetical protein Mkiyose1386_32600 [Mycobacterium kiyosense]